MKERLHMPAYKDYALLFLVCTITFTRVFHSHTFSQLNNDDTCNLPVGVILITTQLKRI